jgi:hypothetical protein
MRSKISDAVGRLQFVVALILFCQLGLLFFLLKIWWIVK